MHFHAFKRIYSTSQAELLLPAGCQHDICIHFIQISEGLSWNCHGPVIDQPAILDSCIIRDYYSMWNANIHRIASENLHSVCSKNETIPLEKRLLTKKNKSNIFQPRFVREFLWNFSNSQFFNSFCVHCFKSTSNSYHWDNLYFNK